MALAVLFLLAGMLAAEVSLFGVQAAGVIGAALLVLAALVLLRNRETIEP
jgi:hypothetical protein